MCSGGRQQQQQHQQKKKDYECVGGNDEVAVVKCALCVILLHNFIFR